MSVPHSHIGVRTRVLALGISGALLAAQFGVATGLEVSAAAATTDPRITNPVAGSTVAGPDVQISGDLSGAGNDGTVAVAYVIDVSGSTLGNAGDCNSDGVIDSLDDVNFDGRRGTILDCEIIGVTALNTALAPRRDVEVGLVAFGSSAASADVLSNDEDDDSTDTPDEIVDDFTGPVVDGADGNRVADIIDVAVSLTSGRIGAFQVRNVGGGTSFNAAVNESLALLNRSTSARKIVFLLSDGQSSLSSSVLTSAQASGIQFNTFAVGTGTGSAPCGTAPLGRLAQNTGGGCTVVTDPTSLAADIATGVEGFTVEVSARAGQLVIDPVPASIDPLGRWTVDFTLQPAIWTVSAVVRDADGVFVSVSSVEFTVTSPGYQFTSLGDSYSAGEGIDPWRDDDDDWDGPTDPPYDSACHRSRNAYAMLLEAPDSDEPLSLAAETRNLTKFAACSSAVLADVFDREQIGRGGVVVPVQFDAVNSSTDLVTMTIGGNDAQFSDIITHCAGSYNCQDDKFQRIGGIDLTLSQYVDIRLALLASQLRQAYQAIATRAPNATVIAAGYPHLLGLEGGCGENAVLPEGERRFLSEAGDRYDEIMRRAAELAGIHFVSVIEAFEPGIPCSNYAGPRYLNGIDVAWGGWKWKFWTSVVADDQAFHPTTDGQALYAELIQAEIDRLGPVPLRSAPARAAQPTQAVADELIPQWVREIVGDLPDFTDEEFEALFATQLDGLDVSSIRAANGLVDPCGSFAVRGQRLVWSGDGFAPGSQVTVTVGVEGPSQLQYTMLADDLGAASGIDTVPGDAELLSTISVQGVTADGVMRLLNGRFYIAEDDAPCLALAIEADELDGAAALYRARPGGDAPSERGVPVILERNVVAAELILGVSDRDPDGDGWAPIGKYTVAQSELARVWTDGDVPYVAVRSATKGCVTMTPKSLSGDAPSQPTPMREVGRDTSDCRAAVPSADLDNDGIPDDEQPLYRARQGDTSRNEPAGHVFIERNVVAGEAALGVSDFDEDGDGWSSVASEAGDLVAFDTTGNVPIAAIARSNGRCSERTPHSLGTATRGGSTRLVDAVPTRGLCPPS